VVTTIPPNQNWRPSIRGKAAGNSTSYTHVSSPLCVPPSPGPKPLKTETETKCRSIQVPGPPSSHQSHTTTQHDTDIKQGRLGRQEQRRRADISPLRKDKNGNGDHRLSVQGLMRQP